MHAPNFEHDVKEMKNFLPPETGASMKVAPFSSAISATSLDTAGSMVLLSISRVPGCTVLHMYKTNKGACNFVIQPSFHIHFIYLF